jgi:hypothetical protein
MHLFQKGENRYQRPITPKGNVVAWRRFSVLLAFLLVVTVLVMLLYMPLFLATLPMDSYS